MSNAVMCCKYLLAVVVILHAVGLQGKTVTQKQLRLNYLTKCTYDYEVTVHTARGAKSTLSDGYQVHALVSYIHLGLTVIFTIHVLFFRSRELW